MTIPYLIFVYAALTLCETTVHLKGEAVELTVLTTYTTGAGLDGQGREDNFSWC